MVPAAPAIAGIENLSQATDAVYSLVSTLARTFPSTPLASDLKELGGILLKLTGSVHTLLIRVRSLYINCHPAGLSLSSSGLVLLSDYGAAISHLKDSLHKLPHPPTSADIKTLCHTLASARARFDMASSAESLSTVLGLLSRPLVPPASNTAATDSIIPCRVPLKHLFGLQSFLSTSTVLELLDLDDDSAGTWLLENPKVQRFISGSAQFAYLTGPPGCGKSVAAARLVQRLARTVATPSKTVCHYFVDHFSARSKHINVLVSTLLAQVAAQVPRALPIIETLADALGRGIIPDHRQCNLHNYKALVDAFWKSLQLSELTFIVLDGIDDLSAEDFVGLGLLLGRLCKSPKISIIAFGRALQETSATQSTPLASPYHLADSWTDPSGNMSTEIETYIKKNLSNGNLSSIDTIPEPLQPSNMETTTTALLRYKNFQLVQCHLWCIRAQAPLHNLPHFSMDGESPQLLHDTYSFMLRAIRDGDRIHLGLPDVDSDHDNGLPNDIHTALSWLQILSDEDLQPAGMALSENAFFSALAVHLSQGATTLNLVTSVDELQAKLSSYLDIFARERSIGIAHRSGPNEEFAECGYDQTRYVLYNKTFAQFMQERDIALPSDEAKRRLAMACLRYLTFADFSEHPRTAESEIQSAAMRNANDKFYIFAAAWWPKLIHGNSDLEADLACELFIHPTIYNFAGWIVQFCKFHFPWKYGSPGQRESRDLWTLVGDLHTHRLEPLHVAIAFGLSQVVRRIIATLSQKALDRFLQTSEAYGGPLILALLGPLALLKETSILRLSARERTAMFEFEILDFRGTVRELLAWPPVAKSHIYTQYIAELALESCASLQDADLFIDIIRHGSGDRPVDCLLLYNRFCRALQARIPHTEGMAASAAPVLSTGEVTYLERVCEFVMDDQFRLDDVEIESDFYDDMENINDIDSDDGEEARLGRVRADPDYVLECTRSLANRLGLPCSQPSHMRNMSCSDEEVHRLWDQCVQDGKEHWFVRLVQDPRIDINAPLANGTSEEADKTDDNHGQTPLHVVVQSRDREDNTIFLLIAQMLELGANVNARDARGRTPLHLVEIAIGLEMLVANGADIGAADVDGRTVWHVLAANRDYNLLRMLESLDPDIVKSLKVSTKARRTPVAEAMACARRNTQPLTADMIQSVWVAETMSTVKLLLSLSSGDQGCFQSDVPLVHLAAELADLSVLEELAAQGGIDRGVLSEANETPYHHLNIMATVPFVQRLGELYGRENLGIVSTRGETAAEAWLMSISRTLGSFCHEMGDPPMVHPHVLRELLGARVGESRCVDTRDAEGRPFWERFCTKFSEFLCLSLTSRKLSRDIERALSEIFNEVLDAGMIGSFETCTGESAILPLARAILDLNWGQMFSSASPTAQICMESFCFAAFLSALPRCTITESVSQLPLMADVLQLAAYGGQMEVIRTLIDLGTTIHTEDSGRLRLALTVYNAPLGTFKAVVAASKLEDINALISATDDNDTTTLVHLMAGRNPEDAAKIPKLQALIEVGAQVNLQLPDGLTPAMVALRARDAAAALLLLEKGADPSLRLNDGKDLCLMAARLGFPDVLRAIHDQGIPNWDWMQRRCAVLIGDSQREGCLATHLAASFNHVGVLEYFASTGLIDLDARSDDEHTPLHLAALCGSAEAVTTLLAHGAQVDAADMDGLTPLHLAIQWNNPDVVRILLEAGADPRRKDRIRGDYGRPPLLWALPKLGTEREYEGEKMATLILRALEGHGGDLDAPTRETLGPEGSLNTRKARILADSLETAIKRFGPSMVQAVIDAGCPVDVPLSCGRCTGLMLAVLLSKPEIVRVLIDAGARRFEETCPKHSHRVVHALNRAALTATADGEACLRLMLDFALRIGANWFNGDSLPTHLAACAANAGGMEIIFEHLREHDGLYRNWLNEPPSHDDPLKNKEQLVVEIADRFRMNGTKFEPTLHFATGVLSRDPEGEPELIRGWTNTLRVLLENGAYVDAVDVNNYTSLHVAVIYKASLNIDLLLSHGADVEARDLTGRTPLMHAVVANSVSICRLLVEEHGADVSVRTAAGDSLLGLCFPGPGRQLEPNTARPTPCPAAPEVFRYLTSTKESGGLGLDPHRPDRLGVPLLRALREPSLTGYILSGAFDLSRVAAHPSAAEMLPKIILSGNARHILPRLVRRWPAERWDAVVNGTASSADGRSPLCVAAAAGGNWEVSWLLKHGADMEMEGCEHGTALMAAAAFKRVSLVRELVFSGARVAYTDGAGVTRSALALSGEGTWTWRWLLVRRYQWQAKVEYVEGEAVGAVRPWSGPMKIAYAATGTSADFGRRVGESLLKFAARIENEKRLLRGHALIEHIEHIKEEFGYQLG